AADHRRGGDQRVAADHEVPQVDPAHGDGLPPAQVRIDDRAPGVDGAACGEHQAGVGLGAEGRQLAADLAGPPAVVGVEKGDQVAAGGGDGGVAGGVNPEVAGVAQQADAAV